MLIGIFFHEWTYIILRNGCVFEDGLHLAKVSFQMSRDFDVKLDQPKQFIRFNVANNVRVLDTGLFLFAIKGGLIAAQKVFFF